MSDPAILVAGAGGVIGRSVIEHYSREGVAVRGVSRRQPADVTGWEHLPVDLLDRDAAAEGLKAAADTTHLVFAAYIERLDPAEQISTNVTLLENTLDALANAGAPLQHVTYYQGHKFYGAHLGRFKTPAKETDERLIAPNFYYDQEDVLVDRASKHGFTYTIFRPEGVIGYAQGTPMNLLMVIAAYVALTKRLGQPLRFPGSRETYDQVFYQVTDAELLARATQWAGSAESARNEAYNITNGDVLRWSHVWAALAAHYGLRLEEPQTIVLADQMPLLEAEWDAIVREHDLVPTAFSDLVDWRFGDMILNSTWDNVSSTIKLRKAGFADCFDTIDRFIELLDALGERRIIPKA